MIRPGQADAVLDAIADANAVALEPEPDAESGPEAGRQPERARRDRTAQRAWTELVTDLPTLLGLSTDPGYLIGYGPINRDQTRALAVSSRWRALVAISENAIAALMDLLHRPDAAVTRDDIIATLMNCIDNGDRIILGEKDIGPAPPIKDPPTNDGHGGWKRPPRVH